MFALELYASMAVATFLYYDKKFKNTVNTWSKLVGAVLWPAYIAAYTIGFIDGYLKGRKNRQN